MGDQQKNYLLEKAIHFSTTKHAGQLRKGTTVPYIVHPLETMKLVLIFENCKSQSKFDF